MLQSKYIQNMLMELKEMQCVCVCVCVCVHARARSRALQTKYVIMWFGDLARENILFLYVFPNCIYYKMTA